MFFAYVLGTIGALAFLDTLGVLDSTFHYMWASVLVVAGIVFLVHPLFKTNRLIAGIFAIAGITELLSIVNSLAILRYVWPAALAVLGFLYRTKRIAKSIPDRSFPQKQARLVGGALVLSGVMRLITVASGINMGTVGWGWILFLLIAAIALVLTGEYL
ncbi:MAG: hypothetical protein DWQ07_18695 [Chloroflexi bacterium]|nr:MAG: hypothetical protein DWQ07_18695 [Chloroflexota bacterium]MBL1194961.1 hypothetical protein [Chloroflexota bacterium]NOH12251.1 hypothetical protein [Chloroflexota bacterium]